MMSQNLPAEICFVKIKIQLCRSYAFVAEHLLYGTQIGTAFEKMSRE